MKFRLNEVKILGGPLATHGQQDVAVVGPNQKVYVEGEELLEPTEHRNFKVVAAAEEGILLGPNGLCLDWGPL